MSFEDTAQEYYEAQLAKALAGTKYQAYPMEIQFWLYCVAHKDITAPLLDFGYDQAGLHFVLYKLPFIENEITEISLVLQGVYGAISLAVLSYYDMAGSHVVRVPGDVYYETEWPTYDGQHPEWRIDCPECHSRYIHDRPAYRTNSGVSGQRIFLTLKEHGPVAVKDELERFYSRLASKVETDTLNELRFIG